jgi:hypothetical protein
MLPSSQNLQIISLIFQDCLALRTLPSGFIEPCLPTKADTLPSGGLEIHEIKQLIQVERRIAAAKEPAACASGTTPFPIGPSHPTTPSPGPVPKPFDDLGAVADSRGFEGSTSAAVFERSAQTVLSACASTLVLLSGELVL